MVKTLSFRYDISADIFAEKKIWAAFAFAKLLTFFQQKYLWIRLLYLLEQVNILTTNSPGAQFVQN